ncbi:hypothetical protein A2U01_0049555, partial [Trifolium medium]|nr:hypothetical protein [Trifolium medium]
GQKLGECPCLVDCSCDVLNDVGLESELQQKVENVSFLYPGLPIGGDPRRMGFW